MARKQRERQKVTRHEVASDARKSRIRSSILSRPKRTRKPFVSPVSERYRALRPSTLSTEQLEQRSRVLAAHSEMLRNRNATASEIAKRHGVKVRDFWKYIPKAFKKDASGKIRAIADRYVRRLEIPGPDGPVIIKVKGSRARSEAARFRNDVFRFLQGDRTALDKWKGVSIQGHELLTDPRILTILGEQGNLPEHFGSEQIIPYYSGVPA